jgi:acyl-CoA dehydrogenase
LLRVLTPIMKLTTGKQAVMVASEILESFGGAGYIEDTGLPVLLRDSQVLPIWEGTTNVLALDTLRALGKEPKGEDSLELLLSRFRTWFESIRNPVLITAGQTAMSALEHASRWLLEANNLEGGARRFALTLGRAVELAVLVRHAQWSEDHEEDGAATAAAHRFAHSGIDLVIDQPSA